MSEWDALLNHKQHVTQVNGLEIEVFDKVFTPDTSITQSSAVMMKYLRKVGGKRVLDIGCGTGILGIYALYEGAMEVVFSDNNPLALENTYLNLEHHNLQGSVVESDLFENIDDTFDVILANLPILQEVWSEKEVVQRFLEQCKDYVSPRGQVLFAWASFADMSPILELLVKLQYKFKVHQEKRDNYVWSVIEMKF